MHIHPRHAARRRSPAAGAAAALLALSLSAFAPIAAAQSEPPDVESAPTQEDDSPVLLQPVLVEGAYESAYGPVEGYKAERSATATKTDTPLINVPYSVQVIPEDLIEDQGAQEVTDIYRNISGVTAFSYGGVTFRGFRQGTEDSRYNGVRGNPYVAFITPRLFNIARVEVLKGPASVLYGVTQPGGLLNYITKKPLPYYQHSISTTLGYYDDFGGPARGDISAESTGPIDDDGTFLYRVGGYYQNRDSFRTNATFETTHLVSGLTWNIFDFTKLTLEGEYFTQENGGQLIRGVPVDEDGEFLTSIAFNAAEPTDIDQFDIYIFQARLDHAFAPDLRLNSTFRYVSFEEDELYHEPNELQIQNGRTVITREFRDFRLDKDQYAFNTNLIYDDVRAFGLRHTLLAGVEVSNRERRSTFTRLQGVENGGPIPPIDLFDPVYGRSPAPGTVVPAPAMTPFVTESTQYAVYLQDQLAITDYLDLVLGGRFVQFENKETFGEQEQFDDTDFLFNTGAVFKPIENVSLYASYAQGFTPQSASTQEPRFGGPFPPEESWQVEAGVKTELLDDRLRVTAAVYQITKENVVQDDPDPAAGADALAALGEVRSRGFELNAIGAILPNWKVAFAYAYNDIEITEDSDPANIGETLPNAPPHVVGLFTRYDFPSSGTGVGLGFDYVDDRVGFAPNEIAPSYTLVDAFVYQSLGVLSVPALQHVDLTLGIENVFDTRYAVSSFSFDNVPASFPGQPRTFWLNLRYRITP